MGGATTHDHRHLEAIGVATATIAQAIVLAATIAHANATGSQGGSSNL